MRLEYKFELSDVAVPRFAVEAVEGIGKLFTLATLVLNVLNSKERVEIVFHALSPEDPTRKIEAFRQILATAEPQRPLAIEPRDGGKIPGSSSYFQWVEVRSPRG